MKRKIKQLRKKKKKISEIELYEKESSDDDLDRAANEGFPIAEIFGEKQMKKRS